MIDLAVIDAPAATLFPLAVPATIAGEVSARTDALHQLIRTNVESMVSIGEHLRQVRSLLKPLGLYHSWLEGEFSWSADTAERYIHVADLVAREPEVAQRLGRFSMRAVQLLAAPSTPPEVVSDAIALADATPEGRPIGPQSITALRQAARPEPDLALGATSPLAPAASAPHGAELAAAPQLPEVPRAPARPRTADPGEDDPDGHPTLVTMEADTAGEMGRRAYVLPDAATGATAGDDEAAHEAAFLSALATLDRVVLQLKDLRAELTTPQRRQIVARAEALRLSVL